MVGFIVNCKIYIGKTKEELAEYFAQLLIRKINSSENYFHIALSGGSTPKRIYEFLAEHHKNTIDWTKVKFFWGDERCVPPTYSESNYKMAYDSMLSRLLIPSFNIFRIKGENNPELEALNYSLKILKHVQSVNNYPRFDLIMLGLGENGHTASIFPNQKDLLLADKIYSTAVHPTSGQSRITLTGRVINNAANVVFVVTGKSKSKVVGEILNQQGNYKDYPASYINPSDGEFYWLLDEEAALQIENLKTELRNDTCL